MTDIFEEIWVEFEKQIRRRVLENNGKNNQEVALKQILGEMEGTAQTAALDLGYDERIKSVKLSLHFHIQSNDTAKDELRAYIWALKTLERLERAYVKV